MSLRVLVACEFSGVVRDAFAAIGCDAWSCDLLPSKRKGNHIVGDVRDFWDMGWDLMIAHPPCTHLCVSGARWFPKKKKRQRRALEFFLACINAPVHSICVENPVGIISTKICPPDQIIQPWMFGHTETKTTCLWLRNLPRLKPTKIMEHRRDNLTPSGQNNIPPSKDRWKIRAKTYGGVAAAMADQWGRKQYTTGLGIRWTQYMRD